MSAELTISRQEGIPPIGLAMTGAAFDAARRQNVMSIEPNLEGMYEIAHEVGVIDDISAMPPMVLVARDANPQRGLTTGWDLKLPTDQASDVPGRYFPAGGLGQEMPQHCNRETLVHFAKHVGVSALTELTVWGWSEGQRRNHAAAFATGILLGQRPLDLPSKAGLGSSVWGTFKGAFGAEGRKTHLINRVAYRHPALPEPFIITYGRT